MADKIKILIEEMQGELIGFMKRQIFDKNEVKEILKKRETLEYGLTKKAAKVKDYLKAIQYEYDLVIFNIFMIFMIFINFDRRNSEDKGKRF